MERRGGRGREWGVEWVGEGKEERVNERELRGEDERNRGD